MYGTPKYHHSNKSGFSKLLTPYIRLATNALSGQSIYIYIYTSLWWWIVNILTSVCYQNHNFSGKGLCNSLFPAINLQPQMLVEDQKIVIAYVLLLNAQLMWFSLSYLSAISARTSSSWRDPTLIACARQKNALENESGGVKSSFYSGSSKDRRRWKNTTTTYAYGK